MQKLHIFWKWCCNNPVKTIILTGILTRLIVAFLYRHTTLYPDSTDYIYLARLLYEGSLEGYIGVRTPGYPLILLLCHTSFSIITTLQAIGGILTLIISYKTFLLVKIKRSAALIITLGFACYLPAIFYEFSILSESITLLLISCIFYFLCKLLYDKTIPVRYFIYLSFFTGYLVMIKPFYFFMPFLIILFLSLKFGITKGIIYKYFILLAFPVFSFLAWSYVNKINTGYFVSTTFYGFNLAQTCVNFADKTTPEYKDIGYVYVKYRDSIPSETEQAMTIWRAYPELTYKTKLRFPDLSNLLYKYSIATIKENPGSYLLQTGISWRDFWKTSCYWDIDKTHISKARNFLLYISYAERLLLQIIKILFIIFIPLNLIWLFQKEIKPQTIITAMVFTVSILQALTTYGTNSRFSYPFEILILLSVLLTIKRLLRDRKINHRNI